MTVRRNFWGALILLALLGLAAYYVPQIFRPPAASDSIRVLTRLIVLLVGLVAVAFIWSWLSTAGVTLVREARVLRHQVGQVFEERYRIINRQPVGRLFLEVRDESELPGSFGSRVLSMIGPRQQRSYVAYTLLSRRGRFRLGPTRVASGDPFGLFAKSKSVPGDQELLVLPYVVNLERFPSPAGQFPGGKAILRRATEVTPQAAGVREYMPGDALRQIHWPSSARRDRLMVKEFEQDPQADVWIFLDADRGVQVRQPWEQPVTEGRIEQLWLWKDQTKFSLPPDTFEYAVSSAGSIASYYLRLGRAVGLVCASEVTSVLAPERGERQMNKILENLAFQSGEGKLPLLALIESEASQLPRASTVVLISPSLQNSVELAVDALLMRSMKPVIVHIEPRSFGSSLGSDEMIARIRLRGVPVVSIQKDADLRDSLQTVVG